MLTSRDVYRGGLVRTISQSYRVARSNLDVQHGKLSRCFSPGSGNADTPVYRRCLVFHDHFFYVRACFSTFSRCACFFFYGIVKTLKRWLAFSRHVIFADIFSFLFHATLWRIRETASKRYTVVDYSVNHWKWYICVNKSHYTKHRSHLFPLVVHLSFFPTGTFEVEGKNIIKFVDEHRYLFLDSIPPQIFASESVSKIEWSGCRGMYAR